MCFTIAFLLLTFACVSTKLFWNKYKVAVEIAWIIVDRKKRGFIADDYRCKCGMPDCADGNISDDEATKRFELQNELCREDLHRELYLTIFYLCISLLSIISIVLLYKNQPLCL